MHAYTRLCSPQMNKIPLEYSLAIKKWLMCLNPGTSVERIQKTNSSNKCLITIKVHGNLKKGSRSHFKILENCLLTHMSLAHVCPLIRRCSWLLIQEETKGIILKLLHCIMDVQTLLSQGCTKARVHHN